MWNEAFNHAFSPASMGALSTWMHIGLGALLMWLLLAISDPSFAGGWFLQRRMLFIPLGIVIVVVIIVVASHLSLNPQWH